MLDKIRNIDWRGNNVKLAIAFIIPFVASILLTPGFIIEYNDGFQKEKKISGKTAAIHSLVVALIFVLLYYFYLRKG